MQRYQSAFAEHLAVPARVLLRLLLLLLPGLCGGSS
jgi:hypothetical protein